MQECDNHATLSVLLQQAEIYLDAFAFLDPSKNDSRASVANFFSVLYVLMRGLCKSSVSHGPALVAKSEAVVVQAITVDLTSVNNSEIQLGCTNCSSYIKNASYLTSGQSLIDLYSSYVCNPNQQNCTTVCISSAQVSVYYQFSVKSSPVHFI